MPLIAYEATMVVAGPKGEREVRGRAVLPAARSPACNGENVLEPNELLRQVTIPAARNVKSATYEVRYKQSHDWPIAFASVALTMNGDRVGKARVVLGAVAPVPWRSTRRGEGARGQADHGGQRGRRRRRGGRGGAADDPERLQGAGGAHGGEARDPESRGTVEGVGRPHDVRPCDEGRRLKAIGDPR